MTPLDQATAARRQAALDPARADIQQQLGLALAVRIGLAAALPALRRACWLAPASQDALINLGIALVELGRHPEAGTVFRRALCLAPGDADAHHGAGVADGGMGRHPQGEVRLRRAHRLRPGHVETMIRLAGALVRLDRHVEAMPLERQALALAPGRAPAHIDLGVVQAKLEAHGPSLRSCLRGIACEPGSVQARVNAAVALAVLGRTGDAVAMLRSAADLPHAGPEPFRNLLAVMSYCLTDESVRWETTRAFAARHAPPRPAPALVNPRDPERRLVVGYLSSDLYDHPVARNLAPVIEAHDRRRVELVVYADTAASDGITRRLRTAADHWCPTAGLADEDVARRIRSDQVDILVIVGGRFDKNRPQIASHRSAPIQMSLFDAGTSAVDGMDYLIADRTLAAPRPLRRERFSERVLRPPSLYVHAPVADAPFPGAPPCLGTGHVTFGCFNSPLKLSDDALRLWARVLRALPTSRLKLKYQGRYRDVDLQRRVLAGLGVDPARVVFLPGGGAIAVHLASYEGVDIALDCFPFTGSTTTWEALWMGVPVVTLLGDALVGRLSASFLKPAGLEALIAATPDDYVRIAVELARDPARLAALRAGLRDRVARSPLCDGERRARQFERLFRATWRRWCGATVFGRGPAG